MKNHFYFLLLVFLNACTLTPPAEKANEEAYINYQKGKELQQQFYLLSATEHYLIADSLAGNDSILKCRLNIELGKISRLLMQYNQEKEYLTKAFNIASTISNDTLLAEILHERALSNMHSKDFTNGKQYLQEAIRLLTDTLQLAEYEKDMAQLYLEDNKNDSALHYIHLAMAHNPHPESLPALELLKGKIYLAMQETDSARYYLTHLANYFLLPERIEATKYLAQLYALENNMNAERNFLIQYIALRESLATDRKEDMMEKIYLAQEYRQQRQRAENAEKERIKREVVLHRIILLALVVILALLYLHRQTRRNRQKLEKQLQQEKLKQMESQIALAHEQQLREQQEIESLNRTIAYYRQLNAITLPILMSKRNSQGSVNLSQEEWDILMQNTDACFNQFTKRLKAHCPQLTEDDLRFCCLVKMELPISLLAEIYHIAKGSISRKKMRLKEKLQVTDISFDEYIQQF